MPARWMISVVVGLWLLVLSGCAWDGSRPLAETAAPVGVAPTPTLSLTPTFTPVPPPADQARDGEPPLVSATPAPSVAETEESCPATSPSPSLHCDKEVLLAIRDQLRGDRRELLPSWHPYNAVQDFEGVIMGSGDDGGRVVGLEIIGVWSDGKPPLIGVVPPQLSRLPRLERLVLRNNQLWGMMPPELGLLAQLVVLDLADNELTGAIPSELGQLRRLQELNLSGNRLEGAIPLELGQLTQLRNLHLEANQLTGTIPPALGQLTQLRNLHLERNLLEGTIPPALGQLAQLRNLHLERNLLTGTIPAALGQLMQLWELHLEDNRLEGTIPAALGRLPVLEYLGLANNQLTGPVPSGVVTEPCPVAGPSPSLYCDKVVLLSVRDKLRGSLREELLTWHSDNTIEDFEGVSLGGDPRRVTGLEIQGFRSRLGMSQQYPSLPPQLSRLPLLKRLVLRDNGYWGSIPPGTGAAHPATGTGSLEQ